MTRPQDFYPDGTHHLNIRVYYEDTDFTGMVYHANYLRYFERGRSEFLRAAGISHQSLLARPDPAAFTLTEVKVTYKAPARIDDLLHITTVCEGTSGAKLLFTQRAERAGQTIALADATAIMIHADGRPRRPIPEVLERLAAVKCK